MMRDKTRGLSGRIDWAAIALVACLILASSAFGAELTHKPVTFAQRHRADLPAEMPGVSPSGSHGPHVAGDL